MAIPPNEQETVICIGRDDKKARIYTCDSRWMQKLDKLADSVKVHKNKRATVAKEYILPEKWVKVTQPRKLNLSDKQKADMAKRAREARKKKQ